MQYVQLEGKDYPFRLTFRVIEAFKAKREYDIIAWVLDPGFADTALLGFECVKAGYIFEDQPFNEASLRAEFDGFTPKSIRPLQNAIINELKDSGFIEDDDQGKLNGKVKQDKVTP